MSNNPQRSPAFTRLCCLAALFLGLAGCGFQLRGNLDIAEPIKHLYLSGKSSNAFVTRLRQRFPLYDIEISKNTDASAYELALINVKEDKRSIGYDALARTSEYELSIEVNFTLLDNHGNTLIEPRKLYGEKTYYSNPNNIIASDNEEALLWKDLRVQVANAMLEQLATIDNARLIELQKAEKAKKAEETESDKNAIAPTANPADRPQ